MPDHIDDFSPVREAYARWWFSVEEVLDGFVKTPEFQHSEDLGDFAEAINTMFTFGPNPRMFPEHPWSFDPISAHQRR